MFQVRLTDDILAMFNGFILEIFSRTDKGNTKRFHVAFIESIKVKSNNEGLYRLEIKVGSNTAAVEFTDLTTEVSELVEGVQDALAIRQS